MTGLSSCLLDTPPCLLTFLLNRERNPTKSMRKLTQQLTAIDGGKRNHITDMTQVLISFAQALAKPTLVIRLHRFSL